MYVLQAKGYENWPNATNASAFSVLPAGSYYPPADLFNGVAYEAVFWSATEDYGSYAGNWYMNGSKGEVKRIYSKDNAMAVRCVKD